MNTALDLVLQEAQDRHAVECRVRYNQGKPESYVFFDCDAFAIGFYDIHTRLAAWFSPVRFVPFHERALMPVFQSWRRPAPNYTLAFLDNRALPKRG